MKQSVNENLTITALGVTSAIVLFVVLAVLANYRADWDKWFGVAWWTAFVFGCVAYWYGKKLRKVECLLVFLSLLGLHFAVLLHYLRTSDGFPDFFFLFFSPVEATFVGMALMLVGGPPRHRERKHERTQGEVKGKRADD